MDHQNAKPLTLLVALPRIRDQEDVDLFPKALSALAPFSIPMSPIQIVLRKLTKKARRVLFPQFQIPISVSIPLRDEGRDSLEKHQHHFSVFPIPCPKLEADLVKHRKQMLCEPAQFL